MDNKILYTVKLGSFILGYIKAGNPDLGKWKFLSVSNNGQAFSPTIGFDSFNDAKGVFLSRLPPETHSFVLFAKE